MFYFYSGNHSNYTRILCFNIFMPKISSGGQFIFIKIMSWPAAKSTGANPECKVCRASYSEYFFSFFFFLIKILDSVTALWVMIWILCCSTSPEINRIMLAKNLVLQLCQVTQLLTVTSLWHSQNCKVFWWEDLAADWKHWWLSAQCPAFWVKNESWQCGL